VNNKRRAPASSSSPNKRARSNNPSTAASAQADPKQEIPESEPRASNPANKIGNVDTHPNPGGVDPAEVKDKIASAAAAARVDADPPLGRLERALNEQKGNWKGGRGRGECVVWWIRMEDMRCAYCDLYIEMVLMRGQ